MAVAGPVVGIYSSADHVTGSFRQQKLTFTNMKASRYLRLLQSLPLLIVRLFLSNRSSNSKESNFNFEMPSVELDFSKESLWARAFGNSLSSFAAARQSVNENSLFQVPRRRRRLPSASSRSRLPA